MATSAASSLLPPSSATASECFPSSQHFSLLELTPTSSSSPSRCSSRSIHRSLKEPSISSPFFTSSALTSSGRSYSRSVRVEEGQQQEDETTARTTSSSMRSSSLSSTSCHISAAPQGDGSSIRNTSPTGAGRTSSLTTRHPYCLSVPPKLFRSVLYVLLCLSSPETTTLVGRRISSVSSSLFSSPLSSCCESIPGVSLSSSNSQALLTRPSHTTAAADGGSESPSSPSSACTQEYYQTRRRQSSQNARGETCLSLISAARLSSMTAIERERERVQSEGISVSHSSASACSPSPRTGSQASCLYIGSSSAFLLGQEGRFPGSSTTWGRERKEENDCSCDGPSPRLCKAEQRNEDKEKHSFSSLYDSGVGEDRSGSFRVGSRLIAWKSVFLGGYDEFIEATLRAASAEKNRRPFFLPYGLLLEDDCEKRENRGRTLLSYPSTPGSKFSPSAVSLGLARSRSTRQREELKGEGPPEEQLKSYLFSPSSPCLFEDTSPRRPSSAPRAGSEKSRRRGDSACQRGESREPTPKVFALSAVNRLFSLEFLHLQPSDTTKRRDRPNERDVSVVHNTRGQDARYSRQPAQAYYYCKRIWNDLYAYVHTDICSYLVWRTLLLH